MINLQEVHRFINWVTKFLVSGNVYFFLAFCFISTTIWDIRPAWWLLGSCNFFWFSRNRFFSFHEQTDPHFSNLLKAIIIEQLAIELRALSGYLFISGIPQSLVDEIEPPVYLQIIKIDIWVADKYFPKVIFCSILTFRRSFYKIKINGQNFQIFFSWKLLLETS